jgi:phage shock protein A
MNTISKMLTLFRGQVRAGSEAILDANALALLDQQLFDTEQSLIGARRDLAALMAERMLQEKQRQQHQQAIQKYEQCAREALARGDDALAFDTAERVAELEARCQQCHEQIAELHQREREFRQFIRDAGDTLVELRQQQAVTRVADRIHRSSRRLTGASDGLAERLEASRDTLERIQSRQQRARLEWQARRDLQQESTGSGLDARLQAAGLLDGKQRRTEAVLARLQAEAGQAGNPASMMTPQGDQHGTT